MMEAKAGRCPSAAAVLYYLHSGVEFNEIPKIRRQVVFCLAFFLINLPPVMLSL